MTHIPQTAQQNQFAGSAAGHEHDDWPATPTSSLSTAASADAAIRYDAPGAPHRGVTGDPYDSDPAYLTSVTGSSQVEHHSWMDNVAGAMPGLEVLVLPSRRKRFGTVLDVRDARATMVTVARAGGQRLAADDVGARVERLITGIR